MSTANKIVKLFSQVCSLGMGMTAGLALADGNAQRALGAMAIWGFAAIADFWLTETRA